MARAGQARLLVIFPGALGDLICALPAIRAIARRHPEASLELMARAELARFAVGRTGAVHSHSIDRREIGQLFIPPVLVGHNPLRAFFGAFSHIYSFFATDHPAFRGSLAAMAGGPVTFIPFRPEGEGHVAANYLSALGGKPAANTENDILVNSRIEVLVEDLVAAEKVIAEFGLKTGSFLLILPGSGSSAKNWPAEHFASLAALLAVQLPSLILSGPAEAAIAPRFCASTLSVAEGLELGTVAGLARLARGFIGNDSGVTHLAAAAGAPGIAIFGPTDPARWRPLGRVEVIRREPLSLLEPAEAAALAVNYIVG